MELEGSAKVCLLAAATFVAVGSALQALNELRAYEDIYDESQARKVTGSAVRFVRGLVGGDVTIGGPLDVAYALFTLFTSSKAAIDWARRARADDHDKWARAVKALVAARNWGVVLTGAIIAVVGTTLDLIAYLDSR